MAAGPPVTDPASFFMSERFERVLEELRSKFDFVILDTPPVLPFPDTQVLCRNTDGVVLVARHGHVTRDEFHTAAEVITSTQAGRVIGVILNMVPIRQSYYARRGCYNLRNYG